jgi:hypothetical protein
MNQSLARENTIEDIVEGVWVLGGVEKTQARKVFLAVVPQRNAETLEMVIRQYVKPGSTIITDCWRGYSGLESLDQNYIHRTINHQVGFSINGINTNTIEGKKFWMAYLSWMIEKHLIRYLEWDQDKYCSKRQNQKHDAMETCGVYLEKKT